MNMSRVIFISFFSLVCFCACQTEDDVYGNDGLILTDAYCRTNPFPADSFTIPFRITENSLGYARVRTHPTFSIADTTNVLAKIKCGSRVMAMIPAEFKDEWYYENPYYYAVRVVNADGKECLGYLCKFVLTDEASFVRDSICDVKETSCLQSGVTQLVIRGTYTGSNIWLSNPMACRGNYGTIGSVLVNDFIDFSKLSTRLYRDEDLRKSDGRYEIDLTSYQLEIGDSLVITIHHEPCNPPVFLNPESVQN